MTSIQSVSNICILLQLIISRVYSTEPIENIQSNQQPNLMLAPRGSTTALMCDPLFADSGDLTKATWFKDDVVIGEIDNRHNIILGNRMLSRSEDETIPDVGFLIIANISFEDQGKYYCRCTDGRIGEITQLTVAYLNSFSTANGNNQRVSFRPSHPVIGQRTIAQCIPPDGYPKPSISWIFNGEPIQYSNRVEVLRDGSLLIREMHTTDVGVYECVSSNIAGRISAATSLDLQSTTMSRSGYDYHSTLGGTDDISIFERASTFAHSICPTHTLIRNGMLWFLVGCLATSCAVLLYLLLAMLCLRPTSSRRRIALQPGHYLRSHPSLAPGFRKLVVPTPNIYSSV